MTRRNKARWRGFWHAFDDWAGKHARAEKYAGLTERRRNLGEHVARPRRRRQQGSAKETRRECWSAGAMMAQAPRPPSITLTTHILHPH